MTAALQLKPCPFCGSTDIGLDKSTYCRNCLASTARKKENATAAEAWNRRADPAELRELMEILEDVSARWDEYDEKDAPELGHRIRKALGQDTAESETAEDTTP